MKKLIRKDFPKEEELANTISHFIGFILAFVGLIFLVVKALNSRNEYALMVAIIYGLSQIILYTMSFLYHGFKDQKVKGIFEKFDHSSIYLLIFGSFLPFLIIVIAKNNFWPAVFLVSLICFLAIVGIILKVLYIDKYEKFHLLLYLAMGWSICIYLMEIYHYLGFIYFVIILLGGVFYSSGILFYAIFTFKYHHLVWHILVLLGSISIYISILLKII